jgi:hypothetical protein
VGGKEKLQTFGFIMFYVWYLVEWLIKLLISIITLGKVKAYYSISLECEAYDNDTNYNYQESRKKFAWMKYIFKLKISNNTYWQWNILQ